MSAPYCGKSVNGTFTEIRISDLDELQSKLARVTEQRDRAMEALAMKNGYCECNDSCECDSLSDALYTDLIDEIAKEKEAK